MKPQNANFAMYLGIVLLGLGLLGKPAVAQSWNSSGPLPRVLHSAVLDPTTNRMIVFGGGLDASNTTNQHLNDVWRLVSVGGTNLSWSQVHPTGTAPAPRFGHSAGYDPASNRMLIFGGAEGFSSPCANDVWALTNANGNGGASAWVELSTSGAPPARVGQGGVYDPGSNTFIIYGGQNCFSTTFSDVWVLSNANGVSGTPTWTELFPAGGPGPRQGTNITYDPTSNELILFGGDNGSGGSYFNDVWVLSNANGSGGTPVWTQLSPSGTLPALRAGNSSTYDPTTNTLTIFGGSNSTGNLADCFVLSNANGTGGTPSWKQIAASSVVFPEARGGHTAVYNPSTNKMTIFGGSIGSNTTNDVLVLSHAKGH